MRPVSASSAQPASASASARQTINQTRGSSPAQAGATRPENSDKSSLTRLSERAVHANGGYGFKVDSRRISSSAATSPRPPSPKSKHEEEDRRRTKSKLESSSSSNPAQGPSSKDLRESESRRASTSPNASDRDTSRPNSSSSSSTTKRLQAADRHAASDPIWAKLEPSWLIPRDRDQDAGLVRKAPQKEKRIAAEGVQLPIADPRRNPKLAKAAGSSKAPLRNIPQLQRVQWTWDKYSVGDMPKQPPSAVVVTQLLPAVSTQEIRLHFSQFGTVNIVDLKTDPINASSTGIAYVAFADNTYFDRKRGRFMVPPNGHNGGLAASRAAEKTHLRKVGLAALEKAASSSEGVVHCYLDVQDTKAVPEWKQESERRLRKRKQAAQEAKQIAEDKIKKEEKAAAATAATAPKAAPHQASQNSSGFVSPSKRKSTTSPVPSPPPTRAWLRAEAVKVLNKQWLDKMDKALVERFIREPVDKHIKKRVKLDQKAAEAKAAQANAPPQPAHNNTSHFQARPGISKSGNRIENHHIAGFVPLAPPPKSPLKSSSAALTMPKPLPLPLPQRKPLPGQLPGPSSILPVQQQQQQQSASKLAGSGSILQLPSFNPHHHALPKFKSTAKRPTDAKKPSSALAHSIVLEGNDENRASKLPRLEQRHPSPASSLSSVFSKSTSHDSLAGDTDDSDADQEQANDDDDDDDEEKEEEEDQDDEEDAHIASYAARTHRPVSPDGRRSPRRSGRTSPSTTTSWPAKNIVWTDDSESGLSDEDATASKSQVASLSSPKRPAHNHVTTNGHGVRQIGSHHQQQQSPLKEESDSAQLQQQAETEPSSVTPTVVLEPEFVKAADPTSDLHEQQKPTQEEDVPAPAIQSEIEQGRNLSFAEPGQTGPVSEVSTDGQQIQQHGTTDQHEARAPKQAATAKRKPAKSTKRKKASTKTTAPTPEAVSPVTPGQLNAVAPDTPALPFGAHGALLGDPIDLQDSNAASHLDLRAKGLVADEEDYYYLQVAINEARQGLPMRPDPAMLEPQLDEDELDLPIHSTGSARTEGYYKRAAGEKAAYLPQRNKAQVDVSNSASAAASSAAAANSTAISRSSRAESRRAALSVSNTKTSDSDIIKFSQLKSRGKLLKFSRSPIHDWGLYAMERIERGDLVIEYIGELIRQQIADKREMAYERSGIGSSYLFRIDDDFVVDATKKGSMSRLINHSCNPNCIAKIITINGVKKIVIYARQTIELGDEITYDYKFAVEAAEFKIPCLCGAPNCRRYLN